MLLKLNKIKSFKNLIKFLNEKKCYLSQYLGI